MGTKFNIMYGVRSEPAALWKSINYTFSNNSKTHHVSGTDTTNDFFHYAQYGEFNPCIRYLYN